MGNFTGFVRASKSVRNLTMDTCPMAKPGKSLPAALLRDRLRLIRIELFGDDGIGELAARLGIAASVWHHYETEADSMPAPLLLRFIDATGASAEWLLHGTGRRYCGHALVSERLCCLRTSKGPHSGTAKDAIG